MRHVAVRVFVFLFVVAAGSSACMKSSSPLAPSADGTAKFSGSISSMAGVTIAGAHLTILSGANKDTPAATGANGRYEFDGLQPGSFNVLIEAYGFTSIAPKVDLFSDIDANFALSSSL